MTLFAKNKQPKQQQQGIPDFAPSNLGSNTARTHFERGAQPMIERNRWFFVSMILAAGHVLHGFSYNQMLPLKQIEAYAVQKTEGGRLVVEESPIGRWSPDKDSLAYFVNQWASNVYDINRSTIDRTLKTSTSLVVGNAVGQLRDLRYKENPMVLLRDNLDYTREYENKSINFIKDDVALLRFKTITRNNGAVRENHYVMTVTFTLIKPKTREQLIANPAGLYITSFSVAEETTK